MKSRYISSERTLDKNLFDLLAKDTTPFLFPDSDDSWVPGLFLKFIERGVYPEVEGNLSNISDNFCALFDAHYYPTVNLETGQFLLLEDGESIRLVQDPVLTYGE